jgi:DNA polymerase I
MGETWLVIDCSFLGWRAIHSVGTTLSYKGKPTGVVFGFLQEIQRLRDRIQEADHFVFAFDAERSLRKERCPTYKERKDKEANDPLWINMRRLVKDQLERLRTKVLRDAGFRNLFVADGYEADDVIASVVPRIKSRGDYAIMVSADRDLYQLLDGEAVVQYNPHNHTTMTEERFAAEFAGCGPSDWPVIKAVAGCRSDRIKGLQNVGEVLAAKFLAGKDIGPSRTANLKEWLTCAKHQENLALVTVPYPGCPKWRLEVDGMPDDTRWDDACRSVGAISLLSRHSAQTGMDRKVLR